MASSSSSASFSAKNASMPGKRYPPSRVVIDPVTNEKWRLCVAAAVLRPSDGALLIGERFGVPNSWQCPQGGVDDVDPESDVSARRERAETLREAAARELYEEMGLTLGLHVEYMYGGNDIADNVNVAPPPLRYTTKGTGSWLERSGFSGQELHWVLFSSISEEFCHNPRNICNLSGLNGERQEFTDVRWEDAEKAAENVWEKKRGPYAALADFFRKQQEKEK